MKVYAMDKVFFIMPLKADHNVVMKRDAIIKLLGDRAILPNFQTGEPNNDSDIVQMLRMLQSVNLVVADLSFERPSCYFELGMVQALGIPCVLIAQHGTQIHQRSGSVEFYSDIQGFNRIICNIEADITKRHKKCKQKLGRQSRYAAVRAL